MMAGKNKYKRQRQEWRAEAIDNFDPVDTSENKPRDSWALREAREEYCKELYGTENC